MRLISWNVAGRKKIVEDQLTALAALGPDLVALQEVIDATRESLHKGLQRIGLEYVSDSFTNSQTHLSKTGPRKYRLLIASRWPVKPIVWQKECVIPWPERFLSTRVDNPRKPFEIHTTHIPPGSTNGWCKIRMLEGIYCALANISGTPRILCGDFNSPQTEFEDGTIVTWGQRITKDGTVRIKRGRETWDLGERNVIEKLSEYGLADVHRMLYGFGRIDFSWYFRGYGKEVGRRFDHVMASKSLNPTQCRYLQEYRKAGLSDHTPLVVDFDIS